MLRQMDVYLNATRKLDGYVANGITRGAGPKHIYGIDLAVNYSAQAAEDASKAAKLANVVALAESKYTVAIEAALKARLARNALSAQTRSFLDASVLDDLNDTRLVKDINDSYYMNTSGDTVIWSEQVSRRSNSQAPRRPGQPTTHEKHERSHNA